MTKPGSSFERLRALAQPDTGDDLERCELCSVKLAPQHRHLLEMDARSVICACSPCAMRFENVIGGRFKLIPRDVYSLPQFSLSDAQWNALAIPIEMAFFFYDSSQEGGAVTALYPSPAGATESLLPLDAWDAFAEANPVLEEMEPDVQALLVHRVDDDHVYYMAPIDTCYKLVGLIRMHWKGLSGGQEVWERIQGFFDELGRRARPYAEEMSETAPAPIDARDHA